MTLYFFNIDRHPFHDTDGLELPDFAAVRAEAAGFARDYVRMNPERRDWTDWAVRVTDESRMTVLQLLFAEVV
jgi:hypothetical protein